MALATLISPFVDTSIGLAVNSGVSLAVIFYIFLAKSHEPRLFSSSKDDSDIDVVRIESDFIF